MTKNYYIEEFSHGHIYGYNEKEEQYERKNKKRNVRIPFLHFLAKFKRNYAGEGRDEHVEDFSNKMEKKFCVDSSGIGQFSGNI